MATSWEEKLSACFLLIYGIPGSGKSLLVDHLLASSQSSRSPWNMVAVHFDDLLPSDLRTQVAEAKVHNLDCTLVASISDAVHVHWCGCGRWAGFMIPNQKRVVVRILDAVHSGTKKLFNY